MAVKRHTRLRNRHESTIRDSPLRLRVRLRLHARLRLRVRLRLRHRLLVISVHNQRRRFALK